MKMNKIGNFTKSRKFYLLLCCVMLFSLFVETRIANSAPPKGIAVTTFTDIDFPNNPQCWSTTISGASIIQYTNSCGGTITVTIVVTHPDLTTETFTIAPSGRLLFLGGSPNVVHIIKEQ